MNVTVTPTPLSGTLRAIPSKSYMHRALLCAALADKPTVLSCPETNRDIQATANCIRALGASVTEADGLYTVTPIDKANRPEVAKIHCDESGSTLRFLLPVLAALGQNSTVTVAGRLSERPLSPLYEQLVSHGVTLSENGVYPLSLSGKLHSGIFSLNGNVSSQFFTGLLTALPLLEKESTVCVEGVLASAPYIDLTESVLNAFGVTPSITREKMTVYPQPFVSPDRLDAEGDWSNAAFWLVAGVLGNGITVTGLQKDSKQGDRAVVSLLRQMGAKIEETSDGYTAYPSALHGIEIYAEDIPDLVPILSVAAVGATGETVITGAARLRIKESDRLQTVHSMLNALGGDCTETEDGLRIRGSALHGGTVDGCNDHRIVMSAAVASVLCTGDVTILGAQAANKSYPAFFRHFGSLGGSVTEER